MVNQLSIHWFRQDLRLSDNPALLSASKSGHVLPIYIFDNQNPGEYLMGGASRWWLHHSLNELKKSLNYSLSIYQGDPIEILVDIINRYPVKEVHWNRCYEPWQIDCEQRIKAKLRSKGILVESHQGSLLWEPWSVMTGYGTPYKVFTPFYRKGCLNAKEPRLPLDKSDICQWVYDQKSLDLSHLKLIPKIKWYQYMSTLWSIGESNAEKRFHDFLNNGISDYKSGRNIPSLSFVSRMSPHLHFGEISPNQLWYGVKKVSDDENVDHFCSELGWREFSYAQLYYNPELPKKNLQSKFDHFPWLDSPRLLRAWKKGETGIPMVDAGMRELWKTGYMHNRVRMIVASFLVKNLRIHWHHGERWFWDTLVDADLGNNSASWQWIAGCGADAVPYFRIFNPIIQGEKFDPTGVYIRQYIPEIASLPNKYLFNPYAAPRSVLQAANIKLGIDYPKPIVDLKQSRQAALDAFKSLNSQA